MKLEDCKSGHTVVDPWNKRVQIVGTGLDSMGAYVVVRAAGSYGAQVRYAPSSLRTTPEVDGPQGCSRCGRGFLHASLVMPRCPLGDECGF